MEYGLGAIRRRSGKTQWILSVSVSSERETEIRLHQYLVDIRILIVNPSSFGVQYGRPSVYYGAGAALLL